MSMLRTVLNPIVMLPLLLMGFGSVALVMVTLILTAVSDAVSIWYCIKNCTCASRSASLISGCCAIWRGSRSSSS